MTSEERSEKAKKVVWAVGALIAVVLVILGKLKLNKDQKDCVWFGLVVYFFAVLAWMDYNVVFIVHDWHLLLMPYWLSLATVYVALAFIVAWHSFMESASVRNAARHGLTVFLFLVGAFADWFFFLISGLPPLDSQWLWMWQGLAFGWWTGYAQVAWSLWMACITFVVWLWVRD